MKYLIALEGIAELAKMRVQDQVSRIGRMLSLDDPRWQTYKGGYRVLYDASLRIRRMLEDGAEEALWNELWDELHHQGDVDQASYAAVPWIVEYIRRSEKVECNALALVATIELERDRENNPPINPELASGYRAAIKSLPKILVNHPNQDWDEFTVQYATTCIALAHDQRWLARAYFELDRDAVNRWFTLEFGWNLPGD